jgi:hypothetical protein
LASRTWSCGFNGAVAALPCNRSLGSHAGMHMIVTRHGQSNPAAHSRDDLTNDHGTRNVVTLRLFGDQQAPGAPGHLVGITTRIDRCSSTVVHLRCNRRSVCRMWGPCVRRCWPTSMSRLSNAGKLAMRPYPRERTELAGHRRE